jgi:hypothetical protein
MSLSASNTNVVKARPLVFLSLIFSDLSNSLPASQPIALIINHRAVISITVLFTRALHNPIRYLLIYKVGSPPMSIEKYYRLLFATYKYDNWQENILSLVERSMVVWSRVKPDSDFVFLNKN